MAVLERMGSPPSNELLVRYTKINIVGTKGDAYIITIPSAIRQLFNIRPGDFAAWFINKDTKQLVVKIISGANDGSQREITSEGWQVIKALSSDTPEALKQKMLEAGLKELTKKSSKKVSEKK